MLSLLPSATVRPHMAIKSRNALPTLLLILALGLTTASAWSAEHVIYAVADVAECGIDPHAAPAYRTAALVPTGATVLMVGDAVYPTGDRVHFERCYEPTWGRHRPATIPVPGNHEYYAKDARGYFDYFGAAAGVDGYVLKDLGDWLLIGLNSNLKGAALERQEHWLVDVLDRPSSARKCLLAFWHHPLFSSGRGGKGAEGMKRSWSLLEAHHAKIILNGHEHFYEAFEPQKLAPAADQQGPREFIVGTGGAELDDARGGPRAANSRLWLKAFGVLKLKLAKHSYRWEFIGEGGKVLDTGSAACHP
jgi:hypothetical protein